MRTTRTGSERVGQGVVGRVTRRVTCTWWLLGLAVKAPWLGPGGPILALAALTGLKKRYSHLVGGSFLAGKAAWALSRCMTTESACSLMSGLGQGHESAC